MPRSTPLPRGKPSGVLREPTNGWLCILLELVRKKALDEACLACAGGPHEDDLQAGGAGGSWEGLETGLFPTEPTYLEKVLDLRLVLSRRSARFHSCYRESDCKSLLACARPSRRESPNVRRQCQVSSLSGLYYSHMPSVLIRSALCCVQWGLAAGKKGDITGLRVLPDCRAVQLMPHGTTHSVRIYAIIIAKVPLLSCQQRVGMAARSVLLRCGLLTACRSEENAVLNIGKSGLISCFSSCSGSSTATYADATLSLSPGPRLHASAHCDLQRPSGDNSQQPSTADNVQSLRHWRLARAPALSTAPVHPLKALFHLPHGCLQLPLSASGQLQPQQSPDRALGTWLHSGWGQTLSWEAPGATGTEELQTTTIKQWRRMKMKKHKIRKRSRAKRMKQK